MNSKFDVLLSSNSRYKLLIYQTLQEKRESSTAIVELKQQMKLSDFKFNNLIDELQQDLAETESLMNVSDKYLSIEHFSYHDYQTLQLLYFKQSIAVDLLIKVGLFESITISEFAEYNFLSSSSVYNVRSRVNEVLKTYGLTFKNSQIIGNEKSIRSFYFQILFNYYGGIESPFSESIKKTVQSYIHEIEKSFTKDMTIVQRIKLEIFLGVQLYRIKNNCYIAENGIVEKQVEVEAFFKQYIPRYSSSKIPSSEGKVLYLFLVLNCYIKSDIRLKPTAIGLQLIEYLNERIQIAKMDSYEDILYNVDLVSQSWVHFQLATSTFVYAADFKVFEKTSPKLKSLIYDFVSQLDVIDGHKIAEIEKLHLYYEYMINLLAVEEIQLLERQINIFVDFSSGKSYDQFIRNHIGYHGYINLNLMSELNEDTDIYVSDFSNTNVKCLQVIWKGSPTDVEWEELVNAIAFLRNQTE
ncbi:hypothetical protein RD055328_03980 [Companilactobacillus sp. RD055328]|uniref:helix-turn-helix domain-containing protein n=1 Tax=Companilactobacillus sp. RD055328 TaxID=2916634 RepID=UPI001FC8AE97|nr:helix-turn-helix domain-containing protein [Companilactobacillus sp. RD055328]GKQ42475.1 hypothetical protein RD055328_03980 [Companilactobacillus sp. RD055328]